MSSFGLSKGSRTGRPPKGNAVARGINDSGVKGRTLPETDSKTDVAELSALELKEFLELESQTKVLSQPNWRAMLPPQVETTLPPGLVQNTKSGEVLGVVSQPMTPKPDVPEKRGMTIARRLLMGAGLQRSTSSKQLLGNDILGLGRVSFGFSDSPPARRARSRKSSSVEKRSRRDQLFTRTFQLGTNKFGHNYASQGALKHYEAQTEGSRREPKPVNNESRGTSLQGRPSVREGQKFVIKVDIEASKHKNLKRTQYINKIKEIYSSEINYITMEFMMLHEAVDRVKEELLLHLNLEMKKAISMIEATNDKIQLEVKTFAVDHARIDEFKGSLKAAFTGYDFKLQDPQPGLSTVSNVQIVDRLTFNEHDGAHRRMKSLKQSSSKPVLEFEAKTFEPDSQPRSLRSTSRPYLNESPKDKDNTAFVEAQSAWLPKKRNKKPDESQTVTKSNYEAKFHKFFSKTPVENIQTSIGMGNHFESTDQVGSNAHLQSESRDQESFTIPIPDPPSLDVNEFFNSEMDKIIKHYLSESSNYFPRSKVQPSHTSPGDLGRGRRKNATDRQVQPKTDLALSVPVYYPSKGGPTDSPYEVETPDARVQTVGTNTPNPKQDSHRGPSHYQSLIGLAPKHPSAPKNHSPIPSKVYYSSAGVKPAGMSRGSSITNAFINPANRMGLSAVHSNTDPTKKSRSRSNAQVQQSVGKKVQAQLPIHLTSAGSATSYKQRFEDLYKKSREQRSPGGGVISTKMNTPLAGKFSSDPNVALEEQLIHKPLRKVSDSQSEIPPAKSSAVSRASAPSSVAHLISKIGVSQTKKERYTPTVFAPLFPS